MTDFEEIYATYFDSVYQYVLSLCRDVHTAEEVTQESFCKAMTHLDRFDGRCRLYVWLCQIAKNTYLTHVRKQKRRAAPPEDEPSHPGFEGELLGSDTWDNNMVVESAKGKDVSIKVTTFYQEGGAPEFDSGIKEWINANPNALTNNGGNDMVAAVTAMGYDAYFTALEAIKAAGSTDASAVLAALPSVSYDGVSGHIAFDEIGDAIRDTAYIKAANTETGAWEFYAVQGVE